MDILTFSEESLGKLKYVHLQKLANKHNIKKRWAKKEELVQCLLTAKEKLLGSIECRENKLNEELEWTDATSFIAPLKNNDSLEDSNSARGTFTIAKFVDPRATYDLTSAVNTILPELHGSIDSRLTFDIPKKKYDDSSLRSAATNNPKSSAPPMKSLRPNETKVKMLTIPYSPVGSRTKKPLHQLSSKSIAIKKPKLGASPLKLSGAVSNGGRIVRPVLTHTGIPTRITRFNGRLSEATVKGIMKSQTKEVKTATLPTSNSAKQSENFPKEVRESSRRKSKSDDPSARRSLGQHASKFLTPPGKGQLANSSQKTRGKLTVSKIPDFAKIHEKQFQKMDSLDEYMNKKADRVKKLFGTPLTRPLDKVLKPQNGVTLKSVKEDTVAQKKILPESSLLKDNLVNARKMINKNHTIRTQTDVKDKNRSHIHGIRTNKRFELQMKFRNL